MLDWLYYILLLLLSVAGLCANILGLPGLWLMVACHAAFGLLTGWDLYVGWQSVGTLLGLAALAEVVEFAAGAAGSKSAGGRKRGMIGAIIGALVGGILGAPLFPPIGPVVGACAGAFLGAAALELTDGELKQALRVGVGAAKGRFYGIVIKLSIGALMLLIILITAIPW